MIFCFVIFIIYGGRATSYQYLLSNLNEIEANGKFLKLKTNFFVYFI